MQSPPDGSAGSGWLEPSSTAGDRSRPLPRVLLTPADAARFAKVSRDTIYREIERGVLPVLHVGRLLRIDPVDFDQYLGRTL